MANDIICEISSGNELICEMSSAGEIVVEINGMTYQSVAAELAEKASVEDVALKADKTYVDTQDLLKADKATTYTKTEVDTSLGLKANKQQEAWITPTLLNGATGSITYAKNSLGLVILRLNIVVNTSAYNTIQATLPDGYRPSSVEFPAIIRNYTVGGVSAQIVVDTSGNIRVLGGVTNGQGIRGTLVFYAG